MRFAWLPRKIKPTRSELVIKSTLTALFLTVLLAACATLPPDPALLDNGRLAIAQAQSAGAEEFAPLDIRQARERMAAAEANLADRRANDARRLADEAEMHALLALSRTQAAKTRADLAEKRRELERLRTDLVATYGEEVLR